MNAAAVSNARITRHMIVAVVLLAVAAIVRSLADAIVIGFGGIVLATVLLSLARPLSRFTGMAPRWSLMAVIGGLTIVVGAFGWLFGNEVANQFEELQHQLPQAAGKLQEWLNGSAAGRALVNSAREAAANTEMVSKAGALVSVLFGATGNLLLIVFLGIYFAADPMLYRDGAVRLVPPVRRTQASEALDAAGEALQKWLVAQVVAMAAVGVLTGVGLGLLGVPLALSLGVLAAAFEFIPVIGPILSAVPGVLLAFAKGPELAGYAVLVYVAVQQIESNAITPLVQRWAVKLPPVLGLLAIVACGLLFGVLGVIFAMPIAVVTMVLVRKLYVEDTLERNRPRAREAAADDD